MEPHNNKYLFIDIILSNKPHYTQQLIRRANLVHKLFEKDIDFMDTKIICKVLTTISYKIALQCPTIYAKPKIYGSDPNTLNFKISQHTPNTSPIPKKITVPSTAMDFQKCVDICTDMFYIYGLEFLHTKKLQFGSVERSHKIRKAHEPVV